MSKSDRHKRSTKLKVLLLDNDAERVYTIQEMLEGEDYHILTERDGKNIGNHFNEETPPNLLVTDFDTPGGGIALINYLLTLPKEKFPYVLFLTEDQGEKYAIDSLGPIPGDFMLKPVKEAELKARMAVAERAVAWQQHININEGVSADLAMYDELTNVLNRQAAYERALGELNRAQRENIPVCLAMIELTNLDKLDMGFGSDVANQAVRYVARAARANVRIYDLVGRWIGPKFLLMLPGVPKDSTDAVIERIYGAILTVRVRLPEGQPLSLDIASGYSWSDVDQPEPLYVLIEQANEVLETAKKIKKGNKIAAFEKE